MWRERKGKEKKSRLAACGVNAVTALGYGEEKGRIQ